MKIKRYGYIPDLGDIRDFKLVHSPEATVNLPPHVDLITSGFMPPVYDQGQLGSCTANGIGGAFEFLLNKGGKQYDFHPSRLFIYYNERVVENTVNTDSGAQIRDGMKVVAQYGICTDNKWPYDIAKFKNKPTQKCYTEGLKHQSLVYQRVAQNLVQLKTTLSQGFPVVIGFTVYDSFESDEVANTGVLNMPAATESVQGGHCVVLVGYDEPSQRFIVRNSWGADWGLKGYFTMPYEYVLNADLATDFWVITQVELNR